MLVESFAPPNKLEEDAAVVVDVVEEAAAAPPNVLEPPKLNEEPNALPVVAGLVVAELPNEKGDACAAG